MSVVGAKSPRHTIKTTFVWEDYDLKAGRIFLIWIGLGLRLEIGLTNRICPVFQATLFCVWK
jgi:hypothetical protein